MMEWKENYKMPTERKIMKKMKEEKMIFKELESMSKSKALLNKHRQAMPCFKCSCFKTNKRRKEEREEKKIVNESDRRKRRLAKCVSR